MGGRSMDLVKTRTIGWILFAVTVTAATPSCGPLIPAGTDSVPKATTATAPVSRIPADVLANSGLEEVAFSPPSKSSDGAIQKVYLIKEGLLLVTRPAKEGGEQNLKMINRENAHSVWLESIDGPITEAPFAYSYPAGSDKLPELLFWVDRTVHCLDLRYGARLWKSEVDPPIASRVIANDTHFYFGSADNGFYAYRKNTSVDDWSYRTAGRIDAGPAFNGERIAFASHDGTIYGVPPDRGWVNLESWKVPTGSRVVGGVTAYSRWFLVGSTDYKLYCLEALDGSVHWSFSAEAAIREAPVVYRHRANSEFAYCITSEGPMSRPDKTLFAVPLPKGSSALGGVAKWRRGVRRVVSIGKDTLYVLSGTGGGRSLTGLDVLTGEPKFQIPLTGFNFAPTNHADAGRNAKERGRIYLVSRNGAIQIIREKRT